MSILTYEELRLPNYVNNGVAVKLKALVDGEERIIEMTLSDVVIAAELAGLNMLFIADAGKGKSQLLSDICWDHFGGTDDDTGNANMVYGRQNFETEDLFVRQVVDLSKGEFDSDKARQLRTDRIRRRVNAVDELNRATKLKQVEFFDLADAKYTFNGATKPLGTDGYCLFLAAINLNKLNGDFSGISEIDRALLNRAHLTFDLDHKTFKPTAADKIAYRRKKKNPRVDVAPPRDISDKIIEVHKEIVAAAEDMDPAFTMFDFLIDEGLNYCEKDREHEKGPEFPMKCTECSSSGKDFCSMLKGSSERTPTTVKLLAYALSYLAEMKLGKKVEIDPLDAALEAFRFTTYHGNLNENIANEQYGGRKQLMMDDVVGKMRDILTLVGGYREMMEQGFSPAKLVYTVGGEEVETENTADIRAKLDHRRIIYTQQDLRGELKAKGVGTEWIDTFKEYLAKR